MKTYFITLAVLLGCSVCFSLVVLHSPPEAPPALGTPIRAGTVQGTGGCAMITYRNAAQHESATTELIHCRSDIPNYTGVIRLHIFCVGRR